jgi:hypothetical protein
VRQTDPETQRHIKPVVDPQRQTDNCHSQLKDDGPIRKEEQMSKSCPVNPNEDVRVVGNAELLQERNVPTDKTRPDQTRPDVTHQAHAALTPKAYI